MPNLMHLTIGKYQLAPPPDPPERCIVGVGPGVIHCPCSLGSASNGSCPALPVGQFSLGPGGSFGSLKVTSDLQSQMETDSSFAASTEPPNDLQGIRVLPAPASSALLDPLYTSTMGEIQNPVDPQNHQTCKYDLLNSVPRE